MSTHPLYLPIMEAVAATAATTLPLLSTSAYLGTGPTDLMVLQVLTPSGISVSSVVPSGRLVGSTWALAARFDGGAGQGSEIWLGYNLPVSDLTTSSGVTITYSASISKRLAKVMAIRMAAPQTAPVVGGTAGAGGTGTSATAGPVTPAVDDLVIAAHHHDANTGPPTYTHLPVGEERFMTAVAYQSSTTIARRHQFNLRKATSISPHQITYTITSAVWVDQTVVVTPQSPTTEPGHTYKGRDLASLDTAGAL